MTIKDLNTFLSTNWFNSTKEVELTKEYLSKWFPKEKFSFRTDWENKHTPINHSHVLQIAIPIYLAEVVGMQRIESAIDEEISKIKQIHRPQVGESNPLITLWRENKLKGSKIMSEVVLIDKKESKLPKAQREIISSIFYSTLEQFVKL